jgi:predicted amino acid dehydrogenase
MTTSVITAANLLAGARFVFGHTRTIGLAIVAVGFAITAANGVVNSQTARAILNGLGMTILELVARSHQENSRKRENKSKSVHRSMIVSLHETEG